MGPFEWTSLHQLSTEAYTLIRAVHGSLQAYPGCPRKLTSLPRLSTEVSTEAYKLTQAVHGSLQAYPGCPRRLTRLPRLSTEAYTLTQAVHGGLHAYPGCPRMCMEAYTNCCTAHGIPNVLSSFVMSNCA